MVLEVKLGLRESYKVDILVLCEKGYYIREGLFSGSEFFIFRGV